MTTIYLNNEFSEAQKERVKKIARERMLYDCNFGCDNIKIAHDEDATYIDCDNELAGASLLRDVFAVLDD